MVDTHNSEQKSVSSPRHTAAAARKRGREGWQSVFSTVSILLAAPLVAVLLMIYIFQSYQVEGPSMETTLHENDRLIVWKMPRTWARITGNAYIPQRGEIVIFAEPGLEAYGRSAKKQLIKRVVGLPGDRIVINNGVVTIYNTESPEGFNPDGMVPYGEIAQPTGGQIDMVIPEDHVFVLGDNRSNSLDSRAFGPVHANDIVGKLSFRLFPFDKAEHF